MEYLCLTMFAAAMLFGVWWLTGRLSRTKRNQDSEHGGSLDGYSAGVPYL
jgi:hypothetical protein